MTDTKTSKKWLENFVLELRLQNVNGHDIGDAVASVESYCADSGESPQEAFGNPKDYAESLALPRQEEQGTMRSALRDALPSLVQLVGLFVFIEAIGAVFGDEAFVLNVWQIGSAAAGVVLILLVAANLATLMKKTWALVAFMVLTLAVSGSFALSGTLENAPAIVTSALPVAALAAGVLIGAAIWNQLQLSRSSDDIRKPMEDATTTARTRRKSVWLIALVSWMMVLAAVGVAVSEYFLSAASS